MSGGPSPVRLGTYRILRRIGSGGMGDVYEAEEEALGRRVAIKVLPAELAPYGEFVHRFRAEAEAVAKLSHPNIVPIHFIGEDAGCHYFAMELVCGESLDDRLARCDRLGWEQAVDVASQCLAGLGTAHRHHLVHRDVKPSNILLERDSGRVLLVDFGLVRQVDRTTHVTVTGVVLGTVQHISPEQIRGQAVDSRTDIYSLGVVFYQMLCGRLPYTASTPAAMMYQHVHGVPTPLSQVAPDVPPNLCSVVERMIAKSPAERFATCEDVLRHLANLGESIAAHGERSAFLPPESPIRRRAKRLIEKSGWRWAAVGGGFLVCCIGLLTFGFAPWHIGSTVGLRMAAPKAGLAGTSDDAANAPQPKLAGEVRRIDAQNRCVRSLAVCPSNNLLVGGGADGSLYAWDPRAGTTVFTAQVEEVAGGYYAWPRIAVTPDSERVVYADAEGRLHVWDLTGRAPVAVVESQLARVMGLEFAVDGSSLIAAGGSRWRGNAGYALVTGAAEEGVPLATVTQFDGRVDCMALSPDGRHVLCGLDDCCIRLLETRTGRQLKSLDGHTSSVRCVRFLKGDKRAVSGGSDATVRLWDLNTGVQLRSLVGHTGEVRDLAVSPDGRLLLSASSDRTVRLWDLVSGSEICQFTGHTEPVNSVVFLPDRQCAVSGSDDGTLRVWRLPIAEQM